MAASLNLNFIQASALVALGAFVFHFLNYAFNLAMGRMLGPVEFGQVAALMSLGVIIGVPAMALRRASASLESTHGCCGPDCRKLKRYALIFGLAAAGVLMLLSPLVSGFLKVPLLAAIVFSLHVPFLLLTAVQRGILHGRQQFGRHSLVAIIRSAAKLAFAIIAVYAGFSVSAVMGALVVGSLIALFAAAGLVGSGAGNGEHSYGDKKGFAGGRLFSCVNTFFWASLFIAVFSNIDIVLAKHFLDQELAGRFAVLSLTGKIILYGTGIFVTAMFPMVSAGQGRAGFAKSALYHALIMTAGSSALLIALFAAFPAAVVSILFGAAYLPAAPYLGLYASAMGLASLAFVFVHFFMAAQVRGYVYPLALTVFAEIFLISFFHGSLWQISVSMAASGGLALVFMAGFYLFYTHNPRFKYKFS